MRPSRLSRRGSSLALALLALAVLACLAFAAAASQIALVQGQTRDRNGRAGRDLAEAAIARALAQLIEHPDWGTASRPAQPLTVEFPGCVGTGLLAFDSSLAGVPASTNNLQGANSVQGSLSTPVAAETAQLLGVGRVGSLQVRVEAQIYLPRFPYVIASSGPLRSRGGLKVSSVLSLSDLAQGVEGIPPERVRPGHLVSNFRSSPALDLDGPGILVSGDAQGVGSVHIGPGAQVQGEVRPFSTTVGLPEVPLSDFDPQARPGLSRLTQASLGQLTVDGFFRRVGDLTVSQGLQLQDGLLYVEGNLTVQGGVRGRGAVIVTGTTTIHGGGATQTDQLAALIGQGDVLVEGTADEPAAFQGLVYTEGNFTARHVQLIGSFVANSSRPDSGVMQLDEARVVYVPQAASLNLLVRQQGQASPLPTSIALGMSGGGPLQVSGQGSNSVLSGPGGSDPLWGYVRVNPGTPGMTLTDRLVGQVVSDSGARQLEGQALLNYLAAQSGTSPQQLLSSWGEQLQLLASNADDAREAAESAPGPGPALPQDQISSLSFDLSNFVKVGEQIRILSWRDLR